MAPLITIEVQSAALLAAMERSPALIEKHAKPAALISANNIAKEWRARFARSKTAGLPTHGGMHGYTGVKVYESKDKKGYIVVFEFPDMPNLALWLEFGTEKMLPHPPGGSLFPSVRLEEGPHAARMRAAVQAGIDEAGLGGLGT